MIDFNIKKQTSESFRLGALLAFSGGFQDAYTYNLRGKVFANAQTGNIVLMSQNIFTGNFSKIFCYLFPLILFALGVYVSENLRNKYRNNTKIHWRQIVVLFEIIILTVVAFIPEELNLIANGMVSFSCAMQVQAFRKIHGIGYATTMCIGNIRSAMENFTIFHNRRNNKNLIIFFYYTVIIILFAFGAGLSGYLSGVLGLKTILISSLILLVVYILMFREEI
ncbi:YoaK family protein [Helcococcus ovis]|uniref:YoaK family protein n=1 Tax=Helcococcus ovis TaxID=72026 RepID=UPI0038BD7B0B